MVCRHCLARIVFKAEHEYCHIKLAAPKTYSQYKEEAAAHHFSIIQRHGAPPYAQPPVPDEPAAKAIEQFKYRKPKYDFAK
jgi:hypothetical protein